MKTPATFSRIFLASQSPRRRELLKQIGVAHDLLLLRNQTQRGADVDESPHPGEHPLTYVERTCRDKAAAAARIIRSRHLPQHPLLAADTTVSIGNEILGKPADAAQAAAMLARLSGRSHEVLTAVAVQLDQRIEVLISRSTVEMRSISAQEIHHYVQCGEPMDKAGAYGIQGRAAAFICHLSGSYTGVMGLPLFETAALLSRFGYRI